MQTTNAIDKSSLYKNLADLLAKAIEDVREDLQIKAPNSELIGLQLGRITQDENEQEEIWEVSWYKPFNSRSKEANILSTDPTENSVNLKASQVNLISDELGDLSHKLEIDAGISAQGDAPKNRIYVNARIKSNLPLVSSHSLTTWISAPGCCIPKGAVEGVCGYWLAGECIQLGGKCGECN